MFYILHGQDELARSEALAELKGRMGDDTTLYLNTSYLEGEETSVSELKFACDTVPFLGDRRLVIARGLLTRLEAQAGEEEQKFRKELLDYLPRLAETTRLIFLEPESLPPDNPFLKLARTSGHGYVIECQPPEEGKLAAWVMERARAKGGRIERSAAEELALFVGRNTRLLDQELEKLLLYVREARPTEVDLDMATGYVSGVRRYVEVTRPVTVEDVRLLVSYAREHTVFELIDAIGRKDGPQALRLLRRLAEAGEHPMRLLAMVIYRFRTLVQVKELGERGQAQEDIAISLGYRPFVVLRALEQAKNFSWPLLEAIYRELLAVDVSIKRGQSEPMAALEVLVARLCQEESLAQPPELW